jgi:hypothetical protein
MIQKTPKPDAISRTNKSKKIHEEKSKPQDCKPRRFLTYEDLAELFGYDGKMVNWRQFINTSQEGYCKNLRQCRIKVGRRAVFPKATVEGIIQDLGA